MMNKRYLFNWTVWISVWAAVYVFFYVISPLGQYGVVYGTFVALPIYFTAGAKKEEFWHYSGSFVAGVAWGLVFLQAIGFLLKQGLSPSLTQTFVVGGLTFVCVAFHFIVTAKTILNKIPAMFGGIAVTFSTGGKHAIPIMITLVLGVALGLLCQYGTKFLADDGRWRFSKASSEDKHS
jgi:hypothetical protein